MRVADPGVSDPGVAGRDVPAVILAGGAARRMGGGDKGLLPLGGGTVLSSVIARLAPQAGALALNANGEAGRFEALGLPVLPDTVPGRPGPLAGVLAAMRWAGEGRVATAAADTPFLPADLIARLAAAGPGIVIAAAPDPERGMARHPVFALWPADLADALEAALRGGTRKVLAFADARGWDEARFDDGAAFFNVNTPGDLEEARRRCV